MTPIILSTLIIAEAVNAILMGEEPDVQENSYNHTGNVWSCFGPVYPMESISDMGNDMLTCAKSNLYIGLMNNMEAECVDIGDGITFIADSNNQRLSPRDLFPLGKSKVGRVNRKLTIQDAGNSEKQLILYSGQW